MEMPVMAANTALDATVATPRPPRRRRNSWLATSKASLPMSARATRKPVSTNSGTTPKMWLAMASLEACASRLAATPTSSRMIQTPTKETRPSTTATCRPPQIISSMSASDSTATVVALMGLPSGLRSLRTPLPRDGQALAAPQVDDRQQHEGQRRHAQAHQHHQPHQPDRRGEVAQSAHV